MGTLCEDRRREGEGKMWGMTDRPLPGNAGESITHIYTYIYEH